MQGPTISIIIPIYKTEKYLYQCLNSVIAQTYTNWEAILVDDGSPDNSGKICDEYASKDKRIKVIHKKNGGVSLARLDGFKSSCGKYIFFLDSDDTLPQNALQALISNSKGQKYICGTAKEIKEEAENKLLYTNNRVFDKCEVAVSILKFERKFSWELWGKLFHNSVLDIETLSVPSNIKVFEDYIITLRILDKIENVKYISDCTYNYIVRENSATYTNKLNLKKVEDLSREITAVCDNELYKKEFTRCRLQMLGWIIGDEQLNKNNEWFKELVRNSKDIKLGKIEKLLITLVNVFNKGKTRKKIYNFLLRIK